MPSHNPTRKKQTRADRRAVLCTLLHFRPDVLRWTRIDTALACAALLGVLALMLVLPSQHPDAAADFSLESDGAVQSARAALADLGYDVSDWTFDATRERDTDLIDSLQHTLGRSGTVAALRDPNTAERLPAYFWRVDADPPSDDDGGTTVTIGASRATKDEPDNFRSLTVDLTPRGRLWGLRVFQGDKADGSAFVDRRALAAALYTTSEDTLLTRISDSLLVSAFSFSPDLTRADTARALTAGSRRTLLGMLANAQINGVRVSVSSKLDRDQMNRMAIWHMERLDLLGRDWETASADSASVLEETARLYYSIDVDGTAAEVEVGVSPTGRLMRLDVDFSPNGGGSSEVGVIVYSIASGVAYALLGLLLLVYFVRRLSARLVDMKGALLDGALVALPGAAFMTLITFAGAGGPNGNGPPLWVLIAVIFPVMFGLFFFGLTILAGSTEGLAREVWSDKMRASALLRKASVVNERVGFALLRGTLVGLGLAGLSALLLVVIPAPLRFKEDMSVVLSIIPVRGVVPFLAASLTAYTVLVPTLLGLAAFLRRRGTPMPVLVGVTTVVLALLGTLTFLLHPAPLTWLATLPIALAIVLLFVRYDFLTAFFAYFFAIVMWSTAHSLLIGGLDPTVDAVIVGIVTACALALGFVGIRSEQTGDEQADYVPAYVTELAQQERMKQELRVRAPSADVVFAAPNARSRRRRRGGAVHRGERGWRRLLRLRRFGRWAAGRSDRRRERQGHPGGVLHDARQGFSAQPGPPVRLSGPTCCATSTRSFARTPRAARSSR